MSETTDSPDELKIDEESDDLTEFAKGGDELPLWKRITLLGWAKVALMVLGLVALVLGAINAWRAEESIALLAVGVIFVLVALIVGPDWTSMEVAFGSMKATLLRDFGGRLEEATEASQDDPAKLRQEIDRLQTEVKERSRSEAQRARRVASQSPNFQDFFRRLREQGPKATHSFRKDGSVELDLLWHFATVETVTCQVQPPEGESISVRVDADAQAAAFPARRFRVVFPNEFPGSAAPPRGRYEVRWEGPQVPGVEPLIAALIIKPLATDAFTLS